MADGNIKVQVSTQAARAELERLRAENAALKRDLKYARDGLTKGRTRMREDNERLQAEVEALRLDAGRYQYVRMNRLWLKANLPLISAHAFDVVVDAAMAAQEKQR